MFSNDDGLFLVSGYLNNEDNGFAGGLTGLSGIAGQLGKIASYSQRRAAERSLTNTLYGGLYQIVKTKAASSAQPIRGMLCFWDDFTTFQVTPDGGATKEGRVAGVYLNSPTKGNWTVIQVGGLASVKFKSSVTDTTDGNLALVDTTSNLADALADAGTYATAGPAKRLIGTCMEAPANSTVSRVWLKGLALNL